MLTPLENMLRIAKLISPANQTRDGIALISDEMVILGMPDKDPEDLPRIMEINREMVQEQWDEIDENSRANFFMHYSMAISKLALQTLTRQLN